MILGLQDCCCRFSFTLGGAGRYRRCHDGTSCLGLQMIQPEFSFAESSQRDRASIVYR